MALRLDDKKAMVAEVAAVAAKRSPWSQRSTAA